LSARFEPSALAFSILGCVVGGYARVVKAMEGEGR
jgi:hypothetical protein